MTKMFCMTHIKCVSTIITTRVAIGTWNKWFIELGLIIINS